MAVRRKNCDYCGRPIELRQLGPDRWKPYDPDGEPHDCPGRFVDGRPVAGAPPAAAASPPASGPLPASGAAAAAPAAPATVGNGAWRWILVAALGAVAAFVIIPRFFGGGGQPETAQQPPTVVAPAMAEATATATRAAGRQPTATLPAGAADPATAPDACATFGTQPWAQSIFDRNPGAFRDLDPDKDGFACEELPWGPVPALWTDQLPRGVEEVRLMYAIDGDTIVVRTASGRQEHVRLVGIDTPEVGGGYRDEECFGPEASAFTKQLLQLADGDTVWLEMDREDRDRYDRLLRYVWFEHDGVVYMANEAILRAGYAELFRNTPNKRYVNQLIDGEAFARDHSYGLWSACP